MDPYGAAVVEALIHPGYDSRQLVNDIGLLRLANPVPETVAVPVAVLPPSQGFSTADVGATLNFAGFGVTETGDSSVRMQVDGVLGGLGCSVTGPEVERNTNQHPIFAGQSPATTFCVCPHIFPATSC